MGGKMDRETQRNGTLSKQGAEMTLTDNLKTSYKLFSVQAAALVGMLAAAYDYLPVMKDYLPDGWMKYAVILIIAARMVPQDLEKK
jgi:hypothetical protein